MPHMFWDLNFFSNFLCVISWCVFFKIYFYQNVTAIFFFFTNVCFIAISRKTHSIFALFFCVAKIKQQKKYKKLRSNFSYQNHILHVFIFYYITYSITAKKFFPPFLFFIWLKLLTL